MNHSIYNFFIAGLTLVGLSACGTIFEDGDENCPIPPVEIINPSTENDPSVNDWHIVDNNNTTIETRSLLVDIPISGYDKQISNLQIFVYDETGANKVSEMEIISSEAVSEDVQLVHGKISSDCTAIVNDQLRCIIKVLANCEATDGENATLNALKFNANDKLTPFYGAASVVKRLDSRLEITCAEIPLLQSSAIVSINLGEDLTKAGITLSNVSIKSVNQSGFVLPKCSTTTDSHDAKDIFNPDNSSVTDINLLPVEDGSMIRAFIPECSAPSEAPIEMEIHFMRDGQEYTGKFGNKLYFKDYATDKAYDIVRGNHYIFNIRSLSTDGDLVVKVEEWNEKTPENVVFK